MRKLTAGYLNEVMKVEAEKQIQARPYERTGKRRAHRNGTRPRSLKTIHGEIELDKPPNTGVPIQNQSIREIFSRGRICKSRCCRIVSRRSVNKKSREVFSKFGLENISASEVSRIVKKLDKLVNEFLNRPIEGALPYLFVDASYFKVRTDGGI